MDRSALIAHRIFLKLADDDRFRFHYDDPDKLVKNPNPHGVREMVTQEYADRFKNKTKAPVKSEPKTQAKPNADKTEQNKKSVQQYSEQKKNNTLKRPDNQLKDPEFHKPGSEVSVEDVQKFRKAFEPTFLETKDWGEGFKENGASSYAGRLKSMPSLYDKMKGRFANRSLDSVGDMVGVRAVCDNIAEQKKLINHIYKNFDVIEHDDSVHTDLRPEGYRAHHFTLRSKDGKLIELQVKTKNQQLYAGFTHDTIYKPSKHLPEHVQEQIKNSPEVRKYTKDLSDHLHEIDNGKQVGPPPEPPKVLKDHGIVFNPQHIHKPKIIEHPEQPKSEAAPKLEKNDHKALFKVSDKTQSIPGDQIVSRASPQDAIDRSLQYADATLKGTHPKRDPLTVWKVKKPDGSSYYSLRDGNTTFQMLKNNFKWDQFPVNVEKEVDEKDLTPVEEHTRHHTHKHTMEDEQK